jgi:uncharacterized protein
MSDTPKKHLFLLYAPDYTDPDAINRRLAVRPKHLENAKVMFDGGVSSQYSAPLFFENIKLL